MNAVKIIHRQLRECCPDVHSMRVNALMTVVESLLSGNQLSVTGLGRHSPRDIASKHAIKQADRLVGNGHLFAERDVFYRCFTYLLVRSQPRPVLVVDWSDLPDNRRFVLLRASIPMDGRSLTVYEEVHPMSCLGNAVVHRVFLSHLKSILPAHCCPIIMTDAGFLVPWFKAVCELGWDFIGRIRPSLLSSDDSGLTWHKLSETIRPTRQARTHGRVKISRSNPFSGVLYSVRKPSKGRHQLTRSGRQARSEHSRKYRLCTKQSWFLFSSLGTGVSAKRIVSLYATRMQIEESFRDLKSARSGFALTQVRCRTCERASNLLLVALIATWILWLIGSLAEQRGQQAGYQANTARRRVLSIIYLGRLIYARGDPDITYADLHIATMLMQHHIHKLSHAL